MSDAHSEPSQKKKWVKRILLILLILLLVITLGIGFFIWRAGHTWDSKTEKFDSITKVDEDQAKIKEKLGEAKPLNVTELKAPTVTNSDTGKNGTNANGSDAAAALAANASEHDKDGDGILDDGYSYDVVKGPGKNILLLGSDTRSGSEAAQVSGSRADSIMLMHIPADGKGVYLVSIMRDTWVNIPGYGSAKINAALNYGGISLQVATVENLLGIKIDHVAEIEFEGFKALVNSVGGVDVQVPFNFDINIWSFKQGMQHMDGGAALAFVRARYQFADGDYQRVRNQRAFLRGLYNTMKAKGALSNVGSFQSAVESIAGYMRVDSGLDAAQIAQIAAPVLTSGDTTMRMTTLPNAGPGWSYDGQSIVIVNQAANANLSYALQHDSMDQFMATYGQD
ncbi:MULTISPECIES: LCP family protein [Rothia]|jgi:transcriptional regulator, LytR family|uniref:LytR family transcriptional regulator n=1 Tax=Rothia mucilaginosa TaxID=43675 RepID=A0A291DD73_9MICC|nr:MULTISPECIES: LCP family protein [Rothia]ATF62357.1 LytR family transcriptional regulator [Rothia mucilaginosa]OFM24213.1 LytR family transcriptional regulator [Rothia sp. HMSC069D01]OFR62715.1 LytR family transcriptional regulator [Rothia sp. HMSC069C04]